MEIAIPISSTSTGDNFFAEKLSCFASFKSNLEFVFESPLNSWFIYLRNAFTTSSTTTFAFFSGKAVSRATSRQSLIVGFPFPLIVVV